ncbi:MAG: aminotransferase class I/II-fold pyridoxal phosphate-dependent enzyme [Alphaproteobacteria bacterium]|nr:aminotransferase class I/II-fold pyridoxal phosphate-dependent enzyme [Alphaproteobacteria bacterium]
MLKTLFSNKTQEGHLTKPVKAKSLKPAISEHFKSITPSALRVAQINYNRRTDGVGVVNTAIGNVSLPMHPAMQKRMYNLDSPESPFEDGVVKYTNTAGNDETNEAFLNIIASSGFDTTGLHSQITDGASLGMELITLGVCGAPGTEESPLLVIDAAYSNYYTIARRLGRHVVSVERELQPNGTFSIPNIEDIEACIKEHRPSAMIVIPYDNPTGQFFDPEKLKMLGELCVKYNMWMVSDEAYRELCYIENFETTSIWGLTNENVPGIEGRRISLESASKLWNSCGLRIGAIITDNFEFHTQCVAEHTATLCSNAIGQYIFGALAHESKKDLHNWYEKQRNYYRNIAFEISRGIKETFPNIIISNPDAALYSVIDVKNIVKPGFDAKDFIMYCATKGKVKIENDEKTLLMAPMDGFYSHKGKGPNPGLTQMRIAYVEVPDNMKNVPYLLKELLNKYENLR